MMIFVYVMLNYFIRLLYKYYFDNSYIDLLFMQHVLLSVKTSCLVLNNQKLK